MKDYFAVAMLLGMYYAATCSNDFDATSKLDLVFVILLDQNPLTKKNVVSMD